MAKKISPMNATYAQLCKLPRDHKETGDFCLMTDSSYVWLSEQAVGKLPSQKVAIPRAAFNRLIRWYVGEHLGENR